MGLGVVAGDVVAVVGGQEGRTDALGQADQLRVGPALLVQAVVLQLHEQAVPPEDVLQPGGQGGGLARCRP